LNSHKPERALTDTFFFARHEPDFRKSRGCGRCSGLPTLVIIHFLQRQSRRVEISTLFLLEREDVQSRAGRRLQRWRNSRLFWWQVLAVLLLAWLLSEPRWVEAGTLQRIALVLDSSLSMDAFATIWKRP